MRINGSKALKGMYVSPQESGKQLEMTLNILKKQDANRSLVIGDLDARHKAWDTHTNRRGKVVYRRAENNN